MDRYMFYCNQDKVNKEIVMEHIKDEVVEYQKMDTIYSLVDYINNSSFSNSKIVFLNFKGNQMDFIIKSISKYKRINSSDDYNIILLSDKKRGR